MNATDIIEKCAEVAVKRAENAHSGCERLSDTDPETGARECSLEVNGGDCLCIERQEEAETIGRAIRALKSSLPAETVSEAMVEEALTVLLNRISKNDFRIKTEDMRAALEAAFVLPGPQVRLLDNDARDGRWIIGYSYRRPFTPVILKKTEHGWVDDGNWYHGEPDFYLPVPMPALPATPKDGRE